MNCTKYPRSFYLIFGARKREKKITGNDLKINMYKLNKVTNSNEKSQAKSNRPPKPKIHTISKLFLGVVSSTFKTNNLRPNKFSYIQIFSFLRSFMGHPVLREMCALLANL